MIVRPFAKEDAGAALSLMRELAKFEGYIGEFAPNEADLCRYGLGESRRFDALVAVCPSSQVLAGIAVLYTIPWTYDLKPSVVLKELFVAADFRGQGVGRGLMGAVASHALAIGASRLRWTVLAENTRAQAFYRTLGGEIDGEWQHWEVDARRLRELVPQ